MSNQCIVVFGGSFDPVHVAHIKVAEHVCHLLGTDQMILLPAGRPWQKQSLRTTGEHRIRMLELAFADSKLNWKIDPREVLSDKPSYSVVSMQALRQTLPKDTSLVFVIGADQLMTLNTWYNWHMLFELVHLVVMARPGFATTLKQALPDAVSEAFLPRLASTQTLHDTPAGHTLFCEDIQIQTSATAIREMLKQGLMPEKLVSPQVLNYIKENNLYNVYGN